MSSRLPKLAVRCRNALKLVLTLRWGSFWWKLRENCWLWRLKLRGIDLSFVDHGELGIPRTLSGVHTVTPRFDLEYTLKAMDVGQWPATRIIDIGCGKGSALITMRRFPFERIAGCDISPDLIDIARENLQRLGISGVSLLCSDATEFQELDDYNCIYFFNPFVREIFVRVMENIEASLARRPREITIIYRNPKSHDAIVAGGTFVKTDEFHFGTHPFFVYVNHGGGHGDDGDHGTMRQQNPAH